jgi:hypothetical protein
VFVLSVFGCDVSRLSNGSQPRTRFGLRAGMRDESVAPIAMNGVHRGYSAHPYGKP